MTDPRLQKLPPQSIEAEESILASCLLGDAEAVITQGVTVDIFYRTAHQKIFAAIVGMTASNAPVELNSVVSALRDLNWLEEVGGVSFVAKLVENAPAATSIEHYCKIVKEKALRRMIIERASKVIEVCHTEREIDKVLTASATISDSDECRALTENRYKLTHIGKIKPVEPQWLIWGILEMDTLALIFGDPACGKSFMAIDMCCSIATGTPFCEKSVSQRPVIYIAGEGQNGLSRRFTAWSISRRVEIDKAPIYVSMVPAQLCDPNFSAQVIAAVNVVAEESGPPGLIVIDTVARNFGPGDENSTKEMGMFIQAADALKAQHKAAVLLVHHSGQADKHRARGNSALKGALDAEYRIIKDENETMYFEATKMKDAELPEEMAFKLCDVEIMTDSRGDLVKSAALMHISGVKRRKASGNRKLKGKWQQKALKILRDIYSDQNETVGSGGYDSKNVLVLIDDWKERIRQEGCPDKQIWRVLKQLEEHGAIKIKNPHVYLTDDTLEDEVPF